MKARFLVDKSALARMSIEAVRGRLGPLIEEGLAATCGVIELEVLYSARNRAAYEEIRSRRALAYEWVPIDDGVLRRALDVQRLLARKGHHRIPIPDLIIAAAAERAGMTVLHYDADYDTIAKATGQSTEWVVPRGTL